MGDEGLVASNQVNDPLSLQALTNTATLTLPST